jgi:hypothetical protein
MDPETALYRACQHEGDPPEVCRERYALVWDMLAARMAEEVTSVRGRALQWLARYPQDWTVLSAGEMLAMRADALGIDDEAPHVSG